STVRIIAVLTALLLVLGSIGPLVERLGLGAIDLGAYRINYLATAGNVLAVILALAGVAGLLSAPRRGEAIPDDELALAPESASKGKEPVETRTSLNDLAVLAFLISMAFMALEMDAGRLVARHLGSSIYGWSSVIAVLLAGLSLGNFLGGKIADFVRNEKQASSLFLLASIMPVSVLVLEVPRRCVMDWFVQGSPQKWVLIQAPGLPTLLGVNGATLTWPYRILIVVAAVFFRPALSMGTVSPVVAKLAV